MLLKTSFKLLMSRRRQPHTTSNTYMAQWPCLKRQGGETAFATGNHMEASNPECCWLLNLGCCAAEAYAHELRRDLPKMTEQDLNQLWARKLKKYGMLVYNRADALVASLPCACKLQPFVQALESQCPCRPGTAAATAASVQHRRVTTGATQLRLPGAATG